MSYERSKHPPSGENEDPHFDDPRKQEVWEQAELDSHELGCSQHQAFQLLWRAYMCVAPGKRAASSQLSRISSPTPASAMSYQERRSANLAALAERRAHDQPTLQLVDESPIQPGIEQTRDVLDRATMGTAQQLPYRDQMERAFGRDLGGVQAFTGRTELHEKNAAAAAKGNKVAFASDAPDIHIVAHETTHILQQQTHGITAAAASRDVSEQSDASEQQADDNARLVARGLAGLSLRADARPSARLHLSKAASADGPAGQTVDAISSADGPSTKLMAPSARICKLPSKLPTTVEAARKYLEAVVARRGLAGVDEILAQLYTLSINLPPMGDTSPDLLGQSPATRDTALALMRSQANVVKRSAHAFLRVFKANVKRGAKTLLEQSEEQIAQMLASYGMPTALDPLARKNVASLMRLGRPATAEATLRASTNKKGPQNPSGGGSHADGLTHAAAAKKQAGLAAAARELQAMQGKVKVLINLVRARGTPDFVTTDLPGNRAVTTNEADTTYDTSELLAPRELIRPDLPRKQQLKIAQEALKKERNAFQVRWLEHERQHPMLAMYRDGKGNPHDLDELHGDREGQQIAIVRNVLPKLRDIIKTKESLEAGKFDPLSLPAAVQSTKRMMGVPPKSTQDRLATDAMINALKPGWKDLAIIPLSVALGVMSAIPTAGASLAVVGVELAGLTLELHLVAEEANDYRVHGAASNTHMDQARALSQHVPSLTGLILDLLSAGLAVIGVVGVIKKALALKRMAAAGDIKRAKAARDALNELGDSHGVAKVGDRVEAAQVTHAGIDGGRRNVGDPYVTPKPGSKEPRRFLQPEELRLTKEMNVQSSWVKAKTLLEAEHSAALGHKLKTVEQGHEILAGLAAGDPSVLRRIGINDYPAGLDPSGREWALVQGRDGYIIYAGKYDGLALPADVRVVGHTHPSPNKTANFVDASNGKLAIDLPTEAKTGGMSFEEITKLDNPARTGMMPSAQDLHSISDGSAHVIYTRYRHRGGGKIGNPVPGDKAPQVALHLSNTKVVRWNTRTKHYYYEVDVVVRDAAGAELWSGKMYTQWHANSDHLERVVTKKYPVLNRPPGLNDIDP